MTGDVLAVCTSERKGIQKTNVHRAVFVVNHGMEGDAHAGSWHRQVSLISAEISQQGSGRCIWRVWREPCRGRD